MYGVLSFFSGGLFAAKFLYSSWSAWILSIRLFIDNRLIIFFVLFESISITWLILYIMYFGFTLINKKKFSKWPMMIVSINLVILLIGAVIEHYVLRSPSF